MAFITTFDNFLKEMKMTFKNSLKEMPLPFEKVPNLYFKALTIVNLYVFTIVTMSFGHRLPHTSCRGPSPQALLSTHTLLLSRLTFDLKGFYLTPNMSISQQNMLNEDA